MNYPHRLETQAHSEFLKQGRIDPITGEKIEEGHTIVICSACKSAFFIESWEYLGETHCNQSETLQEIPKPKNLFLEAKPLEYLPFLFKKGNQDTDNTIHSIFESIVIIPMVLVFMILLVLLSIFILNLTSPFVALAFIIGVVGGVVYFFNKKTSLTSLTFLKRKINPKKATQITLNTKAQGITIKKKDTINTFKFDEIKELRYFVEYISIDEINHHNQCALSIQIITSQNKGQAYYTLLHIDELSKWSAFLEELPYSLRVMNIQ